MDKIHLLYLLTALIVLDVITGFIRSLYTKNDSEGIRSRTMSKGILRKMLIYAVVCLASIYELVFGEQIPIFALTVAYYSINESVSILENIGQCIELPKIITQRLEVLKSENQQKQDIYIKGFQTNNNNASKDETNDKGE